MRQLDDYINIALPKGRLGEDAYGIMERAGYGCPALMENSRRLLFENEEQKIRYFWAKPSDVAIYVERGTADVGIVGKDILMEQDPDIYELMDLGIGRCRLAVAGPKGFRDPRSRTLKVATKFPAVAAKYYRSRSRDVDIICLNGSVELAPMLKMSDVIVDIIETGTTLRENGLESLETIEPLSARLVVNKSSHKFKRERIERMCEGIRRALGEGGGQC